MDISFHDPFGYYRVSVFHLSLEFQNDAVKNLVTKLHSAKAKLDLVIQTKSKFVLENSKVHILNSNFYSLSGCTQILRVECFFILFFMSLLLLFIFLLAFKCFELFKELMLLFKENFTNPSLIVLAYIWSSMYFFLLFFGCVCCLILVQK